MQNFRDLNVWRKGHELTLRVYEITRGFPNDERFGADKSTSPRVRISLRQSCGRLLPHER